jgi:hypothetical protein
MSPGAVVFSACSSEKLGASVLWEKEKRVSKKKEKGGGNISVLED